MINQSFWIQLVSTYEKILFNHFKKVYDEINTLTKNQYTSIFKDSILKFIKSPQEINNLKNTEDLIAPYLSQDEQKDYSEIIKIRNYIVHGSRFEGKHKPRLYEKSTDPEFPIDKAITLLDKILDKINACFSIQNIFTSNYFQIYHNFIKCSSFILLGATSEIGKS